MKFCINAKLKKITSFIIAFSFFISPFQPLFAQEQAAEPAPEQSQPEAAQPEDADVADPKDESSPEEIDAEQEPEAEPAIEEPKEDAESELKAEPEPEMSSMVTQTEAGTIFINNETTRSSIPEVDAETGALHYQYAFSIPPGRNEMTPQLALSYSSNANGNTDPFGYGWSISIPHVSRTNKTGVNNLYSSNTFTSSLDGELIQVGSTDEYVPRVENGSFRAYTFDDNEWMVKEKNGIILKLGSDASSRQDNPSDSSKVFAWYLDEARDAHADYIEYSYYKNAGQIYPSGISYTGHDDTDGIFSIDFQRESRADNLVSSEMGFTATTTYRINRIEARVNGSWTQRYDLGYSTGHNGNRSLLASITKSGRDEQGNVAALPPTNFAYQSYSSSDKDWDEEAGWDVPVNIIRGQDGNDDGARFVDINGDTLTDIIVSAYTDFNPGNSPNVQQEVYLNDGDEWASTTAWTIPKPEGGRFGFTGGYDEVTGQGTMDMGARFADLNKDGYTDILWAMDTEGGNIHYYYDYDFQYVYINNKVDGWATSSAWALPSDFKFMSMNEDAGGRVADVNGDGLPDLLISRSGCGGSGCAINKVYLNNGGGWDAASSSWVIPEPLNSPSSGTEIADVNGDGLADIVRSFESNHSSSGDVRKVYLNNGSSWSYAPSWSVPLIFRYLSSSGNSRTTSARIIDINGDNLPDLVGAVHDNGSVPDGNTVYLNTGESWVQDTNWTAPPYFVFGDHNGGTLTHYSEAGVAQMDVNGDNMIDFVKSGPIDVYPAYPHDKGVYLHQGKVPDILASIEYPEGGEVSIGYEQSARYKEGGDVMNPSVPYNLNTINTVTYDDGVTDPYADTYTFGGGALYYASSTDNQFAGFASTTEEDGRGNMTRTYIHNDSFEKIGKPYLVEKFNDSNDLYARSISEWEAAPRAASTTFVYSSKQVDQLYDGDSDHKDTAIEREYDADTGNILEVTEWGEVDADADGSFSDVGSDKRVTTNEYASSTEDWISGLPSKVTVTDQSSGKVRESNFFYDGLSQGQVSVGDLTKQRDWATSTDYVESRRIYDSYGNVLQEIDPRNATTTYAYDAEHLYPILVTNVLSHTASSTYDYSLGKPKAVRNSNGYISETLYDGLDRVRAQKEPDPSTGVAATVADFTYIDTRNAIALLSKNYLTASTSVDSYAYFDGFGRKIQERTESENSDEYVVRDSIYGIDGLLDKESLPYFAEDEDSSSPTEDDFLFISHAYDPLDREVLTQNSVGSTEIAYDQWKKTVTDAEDNHKEYSTDAYGRLVKVTEHEGSNAYDTKYEWDHNDRLTKITDAEDNVRHFAYDGLGRRLAAEDLHDAGDGTFGTWEFEYDGNGNVTETTDPKGQIVAHTYDALNRPLTENFTGSSGTEISYSYDSCANGKGLLCSATSTSGATQYAYDPKGEVSAETKIIGTSTFVTGFTYDLQGNQKEIAYPDGSTVKYSYNDDGKIEMVEQKEAGGAFEPVVRDYDYGPHGLVTYQEDANGTYLENSYDDKELYRLARKTVKRIPGDESGVGMLRGSGFSEGERLYSPESFYDEGGQQIESDTSAEVFTAIATSTESFEAEDAKNATSSKNASMKKMTVEKESLKLKAPKERHLGMKMMNDVVKYAYRTDVLVDTVPVDKKVALEAKAAGLKLGNEIAEKRTKYSRTFATDKKDMFVTEIVSGDPQYYEDENGIWWLADYATTTRTAYDLQTKSDQEEAGIISRIVDFFLPKQALALASTFYPDPNPGISTVDGYFVKNNSSSWSTARSSASSNEIDDSGVGIGVMDQYGNGYGSNYYGIMRSMTLFDTSALPDSATVLSASLDLYITTVIAPGSEKRIYVVSANPGSNTSLSTADYNDAGSTSFGQSDGSYTTGTYESISLNSSGIAAVSKTGVTKLGVRTYNDFNNVTPTNSNELLVYFSASEQTGTSQDPKLVVVYNAAPGIAIDLKTEGETNPTEVQDRNPEFSGVFIDPDSLDSASSYQIQVSTSSIDWSHPLWDSGKQPLSTPTQNGYRSEEVEYEGNELTPQTTYYWRMKFWDAIDTVGSWSTTTASFSLTPLPPPLIDEVYGYDAIGNIVSIHDVRDPDNVGLTLYEYDDLYRLTSVATTTDPNFYESGGNYRMKVTVDKSKVGGNVLNFPVYVNLADLGSGFWNKVKADGGDIRVITASSTPSFVPFEIAAINVASSTGELYFKAPSLSSATNTEFYIEYGKPELSALPEDNAYGSNNVWSDYAFVSHDGIGDDSGNGAVPSISGGAATTTAKLGTASLHLNGNNTSQYLDVSLMGRTITGWGRNVATAPVNNVGNYFVDLRPAVANGYLYFNAYDTKLSYGGGFPSVYFNGATTTSNSTNYSTGAWGYVALKTASQWTNSDAKFATRYATPVNGDTWQGQFDELRVTKTADLSPSWILTEYNNQNSPSTFYTIGAEESFSYATSTPTVVETYSYDPVGNILSKSDQGSYSYDETGYANPHAVTGIASTTLAYDNNGNLIAMSDGSIFAWNYRNQMATSTTGAGTIGYAYDHSGSRVSKKVGTSTTRYPNDMYESTAGAPALKRVYANGELVASIRGTGPSTATTTYAHVDHLQSTRAVTDEEGNTVQTLAYHPFGAEKTNVEAGDYAESRRYIGQEYDEETELSYLNARYYDGGRGQFTSQDPAFWEMGFIDKQKQEVFLSDPQQLNSYSYARNNPITYKDPSGKCLEDLCIAEAMILSAFIASNAHIIPAIIDNYRTALSLAPGTGDVTAAKEAYTGQSYIDGSELGVGERLLSGFSVIPILGTLGDAGRSVLRDEKLIKQIGDYAAQHSFQKHVINQKEFGTMIRNQSELSEYAQAVMKNPSDVKQLKNGRTAYWDDRLEGVVIHNSKNPTQSTVFRPTEEYGRYNGKKFFEMLE